MSLTPKVCVYTVTDSSYKIHLVTGKPMYMLFEKSLVHKLVDHKVVYHIVF